MIAYGVWGGWQTPHSSEARAFPTGTLGWALALAPLPLFAVAALLPAQFGSLTMPKAEASLDRLFGQGFYRKAFVELGIASWFGLGGLLHGVVGMTRSLSIGASSGAFATSLFFLSGWPRHAAAYTITRRRLYSSGHDRA